jgi:hypothetical protein
MVPGTLLSAGGLFEWRVGRGARGVGPLCFVQGRVSGRGLSEGPAEVCCGGILLSEHW